MCLVIEMGSRANSNWAGSYDVMATNTKQPLSRKDHFVPQGYLRGFVHPARIRHPKPLWVFDVQRSRWDQKSTSQFGFERGFYDYSSGSEPDATAEDLFKRPENDFPLIRDQIRNEGYSTWLQHRGPLLSFAALLTARSQLFRDQCASGILPSLTSCASKETLAKNYSITTMRSETPRRATEWKMYHWVLRYTTNPDFPVIASDQSVGMMASAKNQPEAYQNRDFWLWFPISWDTCLIGSTIPLRNESTAEFEEAHVAEIQKLVCSYAALFVVSPVQLSGVAA